MLATYYKKIVEPNRVWDQGSGRYQSAETRAETFAKDALAALAHTTDPHARNALGRYVGIDETFARWEAYLRELHDFTESEEASYRELPIANRRGKIIGHMDLSKPWKVVAPRPIRHCIKCGKPAQALFGEEKPFFCSVFDASAWAFSQMGSNHRERYVYERFPQCQVYQGLPEMHRILAEWAVSMIALLYGEPDQDGYAPRPLEPGKKESPYGMVR